jgi:iron complex transport system substrate-binding protein
VLFILSTQGGKITAAGSDTAADALIRMAGGVNAISDFSGYKQITDEAAGLAAPEVILMLDRGGDHGIDDDALFALPAIRLTPAAQTRSALRMDGLLLLGFGPRTAEAVRRLNAALYPKDR